MTACAFWKRRADGTDILVHIPRANSSGKIVFSLLLPIRLTLVKLFNLSETRKYRKDPRSNVTRKMDKGRGKVKDVCVNYVENWIILDDNYPKDANEKVYDAMIRYFKY